LPYTRVTRKESWHTLGQAHDFENARESSNAERTEEGVAATTIPMTTMGRRQRSLTILSDDGTLHLPYTRVTRKETWHPWTSSWLRERTRECKRRPNVSTGKVATRSFPRPPFWLCVPPPLCFRDIRLGNSSQGCMCYLRVTLGSEIWWTFLLCINIQSFTIFRDIVSHGMLLIVGRRCCFVD